MEDREKMDLVLKRLTELDHIKEYQIEKADKKRQLSSKILSIGQMSIFSISIFDVLISFIPGLNLSVYFKFFAYVVGFIFSISFEAYFSKKKEIKKTSDNINEVI